MPLAPAITVTAHHAGPGWTFTIWQGADWKFWCGRQYATERAALDAGMASSVCRGLLGRVAS